MIRTFTSPTQIIGQEGERIAVKWLEKEGFKLIERNVGNKFGEIDIVAKKNGVYHFFEVKTGREGGWLNPAENLTTVKLRKFLISCEHYAFIYYIKEYRVQGISVLIPREKSRNPVVEILDIV